MSNQDLIHLIDLVRSVADAPENQPPGWSQDAREAALAKRRQNMAQLSFADPPAQQHSATSRAAASAIREHVPTLKERVYLCILARGPVTDEEIAAHLEMNPSTERPRRIELCAEGLIRAAPDTRKTSSGRRAYAWVTVEPF